MYFWNLSLKPSQSSCLKAPYNKKNYLLLSLSTLYKAVYMQNNLENLIFHRIALK